MNKHLKKVHPQVQRSVPKKKKPMWAVAAAVAWLEGDRLISFETLAERVISSQLRSPDSSARQRILNNLRLEIDSRHSDIFKQCAQRGYYEFATEAARQCSEVRSAAADIVGRNIEEYGRLVQKLLRLSPQEVKQHKKHVKRIRELDQFIKRVGHTFN